MADAYRGMSFRGKVSGRNERVRNFILFSIFGAVILLGGVGLLFLFTSSSETRLSQVATVIVEKQPEIKMVEVLIPLKLIEGQQRLEPFMFRQESRPESVVSERIVRQFSEIEGTYARSAIFPGEPLSREYLTGKPRGTVIDSIPEGYRAVSINVNVVTRPYDALPQVVIYRGLH